MEDLCTGEERMNMGVKMISLNYENAWPILLSQERKKDGTKKKRIKTMKQTRWQLERDKQKIKERKKEKI